VRGGAGNDPAYSAGRQDDVAALRQALEPGVAIDLEHPAAAVEMGYRALGPTVLAIEVDGRRRVRPAPRPVITGIDPQPAGTRSTAAGIEDRQRGVSANSFFDANT
jgi:hypothetical protein